MSSGFSDRCCASDPRALCAQARVPFLLFGGEGRQAQYCDHGRHDLVERSLGHLLEPLGEGPVQALEVVAGRRQTVARALGSGCLRGRHTGRLRDNRHVHRGGRIFASDKALELLDGPALAALVNAAGRHSISPQAIAAGNPTEIACPRCGRPMVKRTARHGAISGQAFWGCSGFPDCRQTVPIID
jgi:Topoisomerase DNA binding C4 zinc finger